MKPSLIASVLTSVLLLTVTSVDAHGRYQSKNSSSNNGNIAAGIVIGTVIGAVLYNSIQPRQNFVYEQPVYMSTPPVVTNQLPVYQNYSPQACQVVRVPVYDYRGRLVQYVQQCIN